jgi:hypothetical protein
MHLTQYILHKLRIEMKCFIMVHIIVYELRFESKAHKSLTSSLL